MQPHPVHDHSGELDCAAFSALKSLRNLRAALLKQFYFTLSLGKQQLIWSACLALREMKNGCICTVLAWKYSLACLERWSCKHLNI